MLNQPSLEAQVRAFSVVQQSIDKDLREAGFEDVLRRHRLDPTLGKIVVARSFEYASHLADAARRYDPLEDVLATYHHVGLARKAALIGSGIYPTSYLLEASTSILGSPHEPSYIGVELSEEQFNILQDSIGALVTAKESGLLPALVEDCLSIDLDDGVYFRH